MGEAKDEVGGRGRLPCIEMASGGRKDRKAGEANFCKALRPG